MSNGDLTLDRPPILDPLPDEQGRVRIFVNDRPLEVEGGGSLAAALWAQGLINLGSDEETGLSRGLYCGIGHCHRCLVELDGLGQVRSCRVPVREGMRVKL